MKRLCGRVHNKNQLSRLLKATPYFVNSEAPNAETCQLLSRKSISGTGFSDWLLDQFLLAPPRRATRLLRRGRHPRRDPRDHRHTGSSLIAFFDYNARHLDGRQYRYPDFPVYNKKKRATPGSSKRRSAACFSPAPSRGSASTCGCCRTGKAEGMISFLYCIYVLSFFFQLPHIIKQGSIPNSHMHSSSISGFDLL